MPRDKPMTPIPAPERIRQHADNPRHQTRKSIQLLPSTFASTTTVALSQGATMDTTWERTVAAEKAIVLTVDLKTLSGFPLSVLRPSNWHLFKAGNIRKE
jgi:hypothetical protein